MNINMCILLTNHFPKVFATEDIRSWEQVCIQFYIPLWRKLYWSRMLASLEAMFNDLHFFLSIDLTFRLFLVTKVIRTPMNLSSIGTSPVDLAPLRQLRQVDLMNIECVHGPTHKLDYYPRDFLVFGTISRK